MKKDKRKLLLLGLLAIAGAGNTSAQVKETYDFQTWAGSKTAEILPLGEDMITASSGTTVYLIWGGQFNGRSLNGRIASVEDKVTGNKGLVFSTKRKQISVLNLNVGDIINIGSFNKPVAFEPASTNYSVLKDGEYVRVTSTGSAGDAVLTEATSAKVRMEEDGSCDFKFSSGGVRINAITIESEYITIGASGYATFTNQYDRNISQPDGLAAYAVSGQEGTVMNLAKVYVMEPGKGYILKGTANTRYQLAYTDEATTYTGENLLTAVTDVKGAAAGTDATKSDYILANGEDGVAFYKSSGTGYVSAGKAYLSLPVVAETSSASLSFNFLPGEITGVKLTSQVDNTAEARSGKAYNIAGQGVGKAYKGLVIINGKKFVK